jgi:hypothetical protein
MFDLSPTEGGGSVVSRVQIWQNVIDFVSSSPTTLIFGCGDWNFSWFLGLKMNFGSSYIESAHNGFVDVFGRLGLLGLLMYLIMLVYFVKIFITNVSRRRYGSFIQLFLFICVLFHGLVEDTNFLNMQTKDMMLSFMTFVPAITDYYLGGKSEKEPDCCFQERVKNRAKVAFTSFDLYIMLLFVFGIFAVIAIGFSDFFSIWLGVKAFSRFTFIAPVFEIMLLAPLFVFLVSNKTNFKTQKIYVFFLVLSVIWLSCSVLSMIFNHVFVTFLSLLLAITLLLLILITRIKINWKSVFMPELTFLAATVIAICCAKILVHYCLIAESVYQPYAVMCFSLISFAIFALLSFFVSINFDDYTGIWVYLPMAFYYEEMYLDIKFEVELIKSTKIKVPLKDLV